VTTFLTDLRESSSFQSPLYLAVGQRSKRH
jgi:hypothetical protein